jgi:hypothetical protein
VIDQLFSWLQIADELDLSKVGTKLSIHFRMPRPARVVAMTVATDNGEPSILENISVDFECDRRTLHLGGLSMIPTSIEDVWPSDDPEGGNPKACFPTPFVGVDFKITLEVERSHAGKQLRRIAVSLFGELSP